MDPENKSLHFIFPTRYVIPKILSRLVIGQVRFFIGCLVKTTISNANDFGVIQLKQIKHTHLVVWTFRCFQKWGWAPKMDGENNGTPY